MSPQYGEFEKRLTTGQNWGKKRVCSGLWAYTRNIDSLTVYYKKIAKAAGMDSFLHKLRHTFASQLVQNKVELYTVCKLLGHRTIQMTEIYAHLAPVNLHKAVFNLPKCGMQLVSMEEKTVRCRFWRFDEVNYHGLPPVAFTLRVFQTAMLFGRANYKEKSTIFSAAFPLLHRLPPMVSPGIMKLPGLTPGVSFAPKSQLRLILPATNRQEENSVFL